ncbi:MAG TPA: hypothetical protein VGU23_01230, partial [Acidobacteriaceae bacterium]|nr:hypothetical protein [Acidobacteriaceae bacterium]
MKRRAGQAFAAAAIWALCLTMGCNGFFVYPGSVGGGGTGSSTGDYVYVANATTQSLDAFSIGTGTLTKIASYTLLFVPNAVAVNPANTMVVVAGPGYIDTFSIGAGGALSQLNGTNNQNVVTTDIAAMDISPDGQWLVGVDEGTFGGTTLTMDEYQISSSGQLGSVSTAAATYVFQGAGTVVPSAVKFAPNQQAVYVAGGTAGDVVYSFGISNSVGVLTATHVLPLASGSGNADNALAVSADSTQVFIARTNGSNNGQLLTYSSSLAGPSSSIFTGVQPYAIAWNKGATDLYAVNQLDGSISGYSVSSGTLSALANSPYRVTSGTAGLRGLVADNSGDYMLALTSSGSPYLVMYSFDSTTLGQLDLAATGTETAGAVAI